MQLLLCHDIIFNDAFLSLSPALCVYTYASFRWKLLCVPDSTRCHSVSDSIMRNGNYCMQLKRRISLWMYVKLKCWLLIRFASHIFRKRAKEFNIYSPPPLLTLRKSAHLIFCENFHGLRRAHALKAKKMFTISFYWNVSMRNEITFGKISF